MKLPLSIRILADPKEVRKGVAMITGEALTDDQLNEKFFNQDKPVNVNLAQLDPGQDSAMIMAFVAIMLSKTDR